MNTAVSNSCATEVSDVLPSLNVSGQSQGWQQGPSTAPHTASSVPGGASQELKKTGPETGLETHIPVTYLGQGLAATIWAEMGQCWVPGEG